MNIPHYRDLKQRTDSSLAVAREPKKTILAYAGILTGLGLLVSILSMVLDHQISNTGGLANLDTRSILSTALSVLPIIQTGLLLCLELGYISAAMRFARKQYADHTDLKTGFRLFGPLFRLTVLQLAIYFVIFLAVYNLVITLYVMTPFAQPLLELLIPMMESGVLPEADAMPGVFLAMLPMLALVVAVYALIAIPLSYSYRMANYRLVDRPQEGALAALRCSRRMMRHNRFRLFKVDLRFWHYYLLTSLATVICYGDTLLALIGVELPMSDTLAYFLFYGIYLVIQFFLYLGFRNRVEVTYVTAYDAIRPQEGDGGVILGNIFDMA